MLFLRRSEIYILQIAALLAAVKAGKHGFGRRGTADDPCDIHHARRALIDLSETGVSFCTAFLHTRRGSTKTISDVTTTTEVCSVRTETTTVHGTSTTYTYAGTITYPQLTHPTYTSTVFIPSGTTRALNKRAPAPSPTIATPPTLATCAPSILSPACSSLIAPTTTTLVSTATHTKHSCLSTTTETITTTRHTTTLTFTLTATPPPVFTPTTGVLTTTVTADCLVTPYDVSALGFPAGDTVGFPQYPDQPRSAVECCVVCHNTLNCVASAWDGDADECSFLIRDSESSGLGVSDICPLGLQDYDFRPLDPEGDILPGPCGY